MATLKQKRKRLKKKLVKILAYVSTDGECGDIDEQNGPSLNLDALEIIELFRKNKEIL